MEFRAEGFDVLNHHNYYVNTTTLDYSGPSTPMQVIEERRSWFAGYRGNHDERRFLQFSRSCSSNHSTMPTRKGAFGAPFFCLRRVQKEAELAVLADCVLPPLRKLRTKDGHPSSRGDERVRISADRLLAVASLQRAFWLRPSSRLVASPNALFFAGFFGAAFFAADFFAGFSFGHWRGLCGCGFFLGRLGFAVAFLRAARVLAARAAFSSASNSAE